MSTQNIPAKSITSCDRCKAVVSDGKARGTNWAYGGGLTLRRNALDHAGAAVADDSRMYDLCDPCLHAVAQAIAAAMEPPKRRPL